MLYVYITHKHWVSWKVYFSLKIIYTCPVGLVMTCNVIFISVSNSFWFLSILFEHSAYLSNGSHSFYWQRIHFYGIHDHSWIIIHSFKNQLHGFIYKQLIKVVDRTFISVKTFFVHAHKNFFCHYFRWI